MQKIPKIKFYIYQIPLVLLIGLVLVYFSNIQSQIFVAVGQANLARINGYPLVPNTTALAEFTSTNWFEQTVADYCNFNKKLGFQIRDAVKFDFKPNSNILVTTVTGSDEARLRQCIQSVLNQIVIDQNNAVHDLLKKQIYLIWYISNDNYKKIYTNPDVNPNKQKIQSIAEVVNIDEPRMLGLEISKKNGPPIYYIIVISVIYFIISSMVYKRYVK